MQLNITTIPGQKSSEGSIEVADKIFGSDFNEALIHQVVTAYRAAARSGNRAQKSRSEVRGGGRKPFRQKGTGRARQGTSRSPLQPGGGTVFGPHPRDYSYSVPKKVRRSALKSALTVRYTGSAMKVLDKLDLEAISTKNFNGIVKAFSLTKPLFVIDKKNEVVEKSARNIPFVKVLRVEGLNVYDIIRHEQLVFTVDALKRIEEVLVS